MPMFDRIKETAKKRGLSLAQLNEKAGMKQNIIYSWKKKKPSAEKLESVAEVLNVSVDYLLGKTDDPSTKSEKRTVDIADDDNADILRFEGRPIPPDDLEVMKRYLRGGKGE